MNFRVGQKVVCVDASPHIHEGHTGLCKGVVYTVREIYGTKIKGVRLAEIVLPNLGCSQFECGWLPHRFRPVKITDISVFTAMLAPEPNKRAPARGPSKKETV